MPFATAFINLLCVFVKVSGMEIKKEFKGNVGLYLVCAELSKQNLIALPTSRNTKGYDVVVLNPTTNKSIGIQVKCSDKKEFVIFRSDFKNYPIKIKEKIFSPFVLVNIYQWIKTGSSVGYYILSESEMKKLLEKKIKRYISAHPHRKTVKKPAPWSLKINDIKKYKDRWGL